VCVYSEGRTDYNYFHTLHYGACRGDELTAKYDHTEEATTERFSES